MKREILDEFDEFDDEFEDNEVKPSMSVPKIVNGKKDTFHISSFINPDDAEYDVKPTTCTLEEFVDKKVKIIKWNNSNKQTRFAKNAVNITLELNGQTFKVFTGSRVVIKQLNDIRLSSMFQDCDQPSFYCVVRKVGKGYKLSE